jgi:hypothetical protein
MRELRLAHATADDPATRAALRAFAAEWPGALRELDTLPTSEIDQRLAACASNADEPWIAWMARYHELMRTALAIRRNEPPPDVDDSFARAVLKPRHGRLNVAVFTQLAREFDTDARTIWDTLFPPRGRAPRPYRR